MSAESLLSQYASTARVPTESNEVFKDECIYSFVRAEDEGGIYVCLNSFYGLGPSVVHQFAARKNSHIFLHIRRIQEEDKEGPKDAKVTRLAIGVEGGFQSKAPAYRQELALLILPENVSLPIQEQALDSLPLQVAASVKGVLNSKGAEYVQALQETASWDGENRIVSKVALELAQLDNGVKIPSSGWKCNRCDLQNNLWLNLTDGGIHCGRRYPDGTGGNGHALDHYSETGFPLAVKLGTITTTAADVYSYAEDDMVEDPLLDTHLAHFGIRRQHLEKTDQSMVELELELNQRTAEWRAAESQGPSLKGPGLLGLTNLGNSCYMNATLQCLLAVPEFWTSLPDPSQSATPTTDLAVQLYKLLKAAQAGGVVRPWMLKRIIGRGHSEFSSGRQQDAHELLLHLLTLVERRLGNEPGTAFRFTVQERTTVGSRTNYEQRQESVLSLPMPGVKPGEGARISLDVCLAAYGAEERIEMNSGTAVKRSGILAFPPYLWIQLKKFYLAGDWTAKKLQVEVDVPDEISLDWLRVTETANEPDVNMEHLAMLCDMGFSRELAHSALKTTDSLEGAIVWMSQGDVTASRDEEVASLVSMGFTEEQARRALKHTSYDVERAIDWLFSHPEEAPQVEDGSATYELIGFITHMGASTHTGHYVAHIRRDGKWILFNDEKIQEASQDLPKSTAYMYLYRRK